MSKGNFQRGDEERNADLHLMLSEKYMAYKDYAERCMITPDGLGKSKIEFQQL